MISHSELIYRLAAAVGLGAAIGIEREWREVPAGLRTHLIVALASATFTIVSLQAAFYQSYASNGLVHYDPGRIASNVVVGIGFLGGGAILQSGGTVKGLTTAASLWLSAAIGLAAGGGMFLLATAVTASALFALVVLRYAVENPRRKIVRLDVTFEIEGNFVGRATLVEFLAPVGATVTAVNYWREVSENRSRMELKVRLPSVALEEPLMKRLEELPGIRRVYVERPE
ncbi:MAG: MgtC/SapB family protein [Isosphaeraceae bacterium]